MIKKTCHWSKNTIWLRTKWGGKLNHLKGMRLIILLLTHLTWQILIKKYHCIRESNRCDYPIYSYILNLRLYELNWYNGIWRFLKSVEQNNIENFLSSFESRNLGKNEDHRKVSKILFWVNMWVITFS